MAEVAAWTAGWEEIQEHIGPRFARLEQRQRVRRSVAGLLSPIKHKNGWQLAEQAGEARPYGRQRSLAGAKWDADLLPTSMSEIRHVLWAVGQALPLPASPGARLT